MKVKTLEIRDRATFIPVFAISTQANNPEQHYLLRRAGYSPNSDLIMIGSLHKGHHTYNYYDWDDRTMKTAHKYIEENFQDLKDGDVIDVEYILGETNKPKISEKEEDHV